MFDYLLSLQGEVPMTVIVNAWWYWTKLQKLLPNLEEPDCCGNSETKKIMFSWYNDGLYLECEVFLYGEIEWFWQFKKEPLGCGGEDTNIEQPILLTVLVQLEKFCYE